MSDIIESGSNEVEIIEFYVGGQSFGVNVAKVKQIIQLEDKCLTPIPNSRAEVKGTYQYREHAISLINLTATLKKEEVELEKPLILITEFNDIISGYTIDAVNRIHRISWDRLEPMSGIFSDCTSTCTGTIHIEDRDVLILDLESIMAQINPATMKGLDFESGHLSVSEKAELNKIKLYFAEDSNFIRNTMQKTLTAAGFQFAGIAEDGLIAWNELEMVAENAKGSGDITDYLNIVISDIEMPEMDGLSLCKKIKEHYILNKIPVVLFSSLINEQMAKKCDAVGADAYTSKPKTEELIGIIKRLAVNSNQ